MVNIDCAFQNYEICTNFAIMKAGNAAQIAICVSHLENVIPFYAILGFRKVDEDVVPNRWVLITDGVIQILLSESVQKYTALYYISPDAPERVAAFVGQGLRPSALVDNPNEPYQALFFDPNRFGIMMIQHDTYFVPNGTVLGECGQFGELSIRVNDLPYSINYWLRMGFECIYHAQVPYPLAIMSDEIMQIGLHQTTNFTNPTLTYFSPQMPEIIQRLKKEGLVFTQEIPNSSGIIANAVLHAPEGQAFFLFEGNAPNA